MIINNKDNVKVLLNDKNGISKGHKIALSDINKGEKVIKYGLPIATASEDIKSGTWVHTHNVKTNLEKELSYKYTPIDDTAAIDIKEKKINVYVRANGDIAVRNELWIIPTVGCVNGICKNLRNMFEAKHKNLEIDGIFDFNHNYGCSQMGDDHETTKLILRNLAMHPNAGGVLVIGLGCENNQVEQFKEIFGEYDKERIKFLVAQESEDEYDEGMQILNTLYEKMKVDKRSQESISKLKIGLKCGGSDGLSGITANPLLGHLSDYIIQYGGTSVLSEVPEMFGAETILMNRCQNEEIFNKTVKMINDFKEYFLSHGQVVYDNPSPGNKKGGISTLEDKSLGCIQKAGRSRIVDVLDYGDILQKNGLHLLNAPGNDLVVVTALVSAGCHIILFTTGRGTPYGGSVPTIKISTNTNLYKRKTNWIDFDAGEIITQNKTMDEMTASLVDYLVDVAGGKRTNNEINNMKEIAIWKNGVTV